MRKQPTPAEALLWRRLRNGQLGLRFRRQQPIAGYIVDFYCAAARLAIELDGGGHTDPQQQAYDEARDRTLARAGIRTVRLWNNDVLCSPDAVLDHIANALRSAQAPGLDR